MCIFVQGVLQYPRVRALSRPFQLQLEHQPKQATTSQWQSLILIFRVVVQLGGVVTSQHWARACSLACSRGSSPEISSNSSIANAIAVYTLTEPETLVRLDLRPVQRCISNLQSIKKKTPVLTVGAISMFSYQSTCTQPGNLRAICIMLSADWPSQQANNKN